MLQWHILLFSKGGKGGLAPHLSCLHAVQVQSSCNDMLHVPELGVFGLEPSVLGWPPLPTSANGCGRYKCLFFTDALTVH